MKPFLDRRNMKDMRMKFSKPIPFMFFMYLLSQLIFKK